MGKHLIQKENNEKNIKISKQEIEPAKIEEHAENKKTDNVLKLFTIPRKSASGLLGVVISAILLVILPFLPIQGWPLILSYSIVLIFAALELIWDVVDRFQLKDYFAYQNIILISSILIFALGYSFEAVLLAVLYRITKLIYDNTGKSSWSKIKEYAKNVPDAASVETPEGILTVQASVVNVGDIIKIDAGEFIPLDGIIVEGITTIDTSFISGQNTALAITEGHRVYSGCKNITSPIRVKVTKPYEKSTANSLVQLAQMAPEYSSRQEKFANIIKSYYSLAIFIAAFLLCVSLSVITGQWYENLGKAATVLIAAVSSAGLSSIGFTYVRSIGSAAESGIFVKGSDCIESMARAETMVFDKTGIITEGRYTITDVFPNKVSEQQLLSMAATAERFSRHPIAAALRDAAGPIDIDYKSLQIEEIPGRGISAFVGEKQVYVGNTALLEEHGIKCAIPTRSGAAIHVAVDYKYWGHILITDRIRRGAFDSLETLRANGIKKLVLLTGDVLSVAKPLASKLNFDMLRAELKPSEKASAVDFLMANRGDSTTLAFVGDGNSDEQIMSRVDVGISIGAIGSDAAMASADVLIMDRDIKKISTAVNISRFCYRVALENLLAWFVVNVLLIIFGAIGVLPIMAAIIIEFVLNCALFINTSRIK